MNQTTILFLGGFCAACNKPPIIETPRTALACAPAVRGVLTESGPEELNVDESPALLRVSNCTPPGESDSGLADFLNKWISSGGRAPKIAYKKGVVFIESEEDRGDDPPHPTSVEPEAMRVCGTPALWLRAAAQQHILTYSASCCGFSCTIGDVVEYSPLSQLSFSLQHGEWVFDSWTSEYIAALSNEDRNRNRRHLELSERRLRDTMCVGEPEGYYW